MARRNRVNQGPLLIMMLPILAGWLYWQSGATTLRSPAGLLLLLTLLVVVNAFLRKKTRPGQKTRTSAHNPYGHIPRRAERDRYVRSQHAFSRTNRAADPETWPYDGSYCVHCGLKKIGENDICRRCGQPIDYSS